MIVAELLYILTMVILLYIIIKSIRFLIRTWDDYNINEDFQIAVFFITLFILLPAIIGMFGWYIVVKYGALIAESFINLMEMEL